jgi:glycosyltransferase involved in cell wall biosynthesis
MIRALAMTPYPQDRVPGQRFRIEQWAPLLRSEGIEVVFSPFLSAAAMDVLYRPGHMTQKIGGTLKGYLKRCTEALRGQPADVVFIYREAALLGPPVLEGILARRTPLVLDFDDAVYLGDTSSANPWSRILKSMGKTEAICRLASHVTVGNEFLARFARRHARAVTVVPTTIDTDRYDVRPRPENPRPVVGWSGSATTLPYLATLAPALQRLGERQEFEFRVIGGEVQIEGVQVQCKHWRADTEVEDLRSFDVGLMPLSDDQWSRGKCGLKALQYMALGIPPVVSPVGVNTSIVRDGINGFHARTEEEWVDRIALLLSDESLRRRMGTEARRTVEQSYSHRVHVPRIARVLREAAAG